MERYKHLTPHKKEWLGAGWYMSMEDLLPIIGVGSGAGGGGQAPNNLRRGGGQHTLWPPQ